MWVRVPRGSNPCKWCQSHAGQSENYKDINFARHDNCQCAIINTGTGDFVGKTSKGYLFKDDESFFMQSITNEFKKITDIAGDNLRKEHQDTIDRNLRFKRLKTHYDKAIEKGELTPLVDFELYKQVDNRIRSELHGLQTANGIEIKSHSLHFIDRIFGTVEKRRSGVSIEDVTEVLKSGNVNVRKERLKSVKYTNEKCAVSINPGTGKLIQTNPYTKKGREK